MTNRILHIFLLIASIAGAFLLLTQCAALGLYTAGSAADVLIQAGLVPETGRADVVGALSSGVAAGSSYWWANIMQIIITVGGAILLGTPTSVVATNYLRNRVYGGATARTEIVEQVKEELHPKAAAPATG